MSLMNCSKGHENSTGSRFCYRCGEPLPAPGVPTVVIETDLMPGTRLRDRYIIQRKLGQGGFGSTYLALDTGRFNEKIAIKELTPSAQGTYALQKAEELFEREAVMLHKLQHPQIPRFWEFFRDRKRLFLIQDYIGGQTYQSLLEDRLPLGQRFSEAEIIQLFQQLLPVLSYLHRQGVIHRDISPDNIIRRSPDGLSVLIDLGGVKQIAIDIASQVVQAQNLSSSGGGTRLGKIGYAPDEQLRMGIVAPNSDLYALGVTAVVLLTGQQPQQLIDPQTMTWVWNRQLKLSPKLSRILNRMLATRPSERFQSAEEIFQQLSSGVKETRLDNHHNQLIQAENQALTNKAHQRSGAIGSVITISSLLALVVGLGIVGLMSQNEQPSTLNTPTPESSMVSPSNDEPSEPVADQLTVGEAFLAEKDDHGNIVSTEKMVFQRDETVIFALRDVGRFQKGEDGKNWFDLDMQVQDSNGTVVFSQQDLLGEEGHFDLPNDIAQFPYIPYVSFTPNSNLESGEYKIQLTIYDKISGNKATETTSFFLE